MKPIALYYRILRYQPDNIRLLERYFDVVELETPAQVTDDVLSRVELLFAPLGFMVDAAFMDQCPRLRVVASNTTGIPHIDLQAALQRGVTVCALHDERVFLDTITPTAELAIGLMLAAGRRIPAAHKAACSGHWDRRPWWAPRMLSRLRLGIVGYGRLGRKVGMTASAMGMDVAWYDPNVLSGKGKISNLLQLASRSDVLSLHAVANEDTQGLVSRRVLEAMPKQAIVVNTARGELLDTDALIDLLECGHLWAAALDTVSGEYRNNFSDEFSKSRIAQYARTHDNLILTPHIGGSTLDAWSETERKVISKSCCVFGITID